MRMYGLIGLVLALLVVGLVARRQVSAPAGVVAPGTTPQSASARGAQVRQDVQRQLDQAMQRPRVPDDQ